LEQAISGATRVGAEVKHVVLSERRIAPCIACNRCFKTGRCAVPDDFQELCDDVLQADGILLASPIFFMNVSAQTKAFIDRFQCVWALRSVLEKKVPPPAGGGKRQVAFLSTAGWAKTSFDCALQTVRAFLVTIDARLTGTLMVNGVDDKGDVDQHPELLRQARELGMRIASASVGAPSGTVMPSAP
jgi:multimeric flavodoxin WrbA